jgi:hypothetical protein
MYDLIRDYRGKQIIMMTGDLPKVTKRRKHLLASQRKGIRNQRVEYHIIPSESEEKYKRPPADCYKGGQPRVHPRVPR